jgi:hypothetical protein
MLQMLKSKEKELKKTRGKIATLSDGEKLNLISRWNFG